MGALEYFMKVESCPTQSAISEEANSGNKLTSTLYSQIIAISYKECYRIIAVLIVAREGFELSAVQNRWFLVAELWDLNPFGY